MNGKDMFLGLNYVNAKFVDEAESVTEFRRERKIPSIRKVTLIAAVIALLVLTITACAYAIQRIRMNYVQHNVSVQTETDIENASEQVVPEKNLLTDCYPQTLPEGYAIVSSSPTDHHSRGIVYENESGHEIHFQISSVPREDDFALRPPVEESTVTLTCGDARYLKNEGAQVLIWKDTEAGYDASLYTDDITVDLISMANSMEYGTPIPLSAWYHRGQEWNPWYPQVLPDGYRCVDVAPISGGFQSYIYENNGDGYIRFGISTEKDLVPAELSDQAHFEEVFVHGEAAQMVCNQSTQRTLYWENTEEGFWALLETMDDTIDLISLAESVGPGEKLPVSDSWLGPDYSIELEQDPTTYIAWKSIYPQNIPEGYVLKTVGDKAYGQQTVVWENDAGDTITYTLYFRLGEYGREFEGSGQPEVVQINGNTGYRTGNRLLWADEALGFAFDLQVSGDMDLIALAESVAPGPELQITDPYTAQALEQLGDYRITKFPETMIEDGLSGFPLEKEDDWYSYVRRWYYNTENNHQIFFTYETYITDLTNVEDTLRLNVSGDGEPEMVTINGCPGIALQDGSRGKVVWLQGNAAKGVSFQLISEHFTIEELLAAAESIQKF